MRERIAAALIVYPENVTIRSERLLLLKTQISGSIRIIFAQIARFIGDRMCEIMTGFFQITVLLCRLFPMIGIYTGTKTFMDDGLFFRQVIVVFVVCKIVPQASMMNRKGDQCLLVLEHKGCFRQNNSDFLRKHIRYGQRDVTVVYLICG